MEMISNEEKITQAVLVSVDTGDYDAEASLAELKELVKSAGAEPVFTVTQNLKRPETGTYVGTGKLQEIADICKQQEIDLLVFDCELSPTQIRNIEAETDTRTIDRTMLILDIFALRARSKEGKLQVELAQLKYLMPRLTGKGVAMSRLGGGIGTRGPGETKLETDRRHISRRMETLKSELAEVDPTALLTIEKGNNMAKEAKTNAMRMLERAKVTYTSHEYPHEEGQAVDGANVARLTGQDPARVFKTLVTQGADRNYYVFVVPVLAELDLKKAAKAAGVKSVAMIHVADINKVTGYIRGGCSPVGMKKQFVTVYDESCLAQQTMLVSGGRIGTQIECAPADLIKVTRGRTAAITQEHEA